MKMKNPQVCFLLGIMLICLIPVGSAQSGYPAPELVYGCPSGTLTDPVIYKYNIGTASQFHYTDEIALIQPGLIEGNYLFYVRAIEDLEGRKGISVTNFGSTTPIRSLYKSTQVRSLVAENCINVTTNQLFPGEDLDSLEDEIKFIGKTNRNLGRRAQDDNRSPLFKRTYTICNSTTGICDTYNPNDENDEFTIIYIFEEE